MLRPQRAPQKTPVLDRKALPVVVEVGVDVDPAAPLDDAIPPFLELASRVVPGPAAAVVEADERPVRGQLASLERPLGMVADGQRGLPLAEQGVDVGREPALVAELDGVAPGRECVEKGCEPLVVAVEIARKLPEHRPELP